MKKLALAGLSVSLMLSLASCGGSSSTSTTAVAANLQTLTVPAYTNADTLAAYNAINAFRNSLGLGYWAQNTLLDQAAANHMAYSIANDPTFQLDLESSNLTGFTGIYPADRATHVGYSNGGTLNLNPLSNPQTYAYNVVGEFYSTGIGANVVSNMVNTIYERSGLMAQTTREIGIANDAGGGAATSATHWWFNHGRTDAGQYNASTFTTFYPLNLQTGVPRTMDVESTLPPAGISQTPGSTGSPVCFVTAEGTTLTVTAFNISANGSPVAATVLLANLGNGNTSTVTPVVYDPTSLSVPVTTQPHLTSNQAYLIPSAPLSPLTTYTVTFTGSSYLPSYGITTALSQTWTFTTGS